MVYGFVRGFRRLWRIPAIIYYLLSQALIVRWQRRKMPSDPREQARFVTEQTRNWALGLTRILGIRLEWMGEGTVVPEDGGLVIANHQSYLDILVHASVGGMCFTPNTGIRNWFFLGWYVNQSNPVWIDRTTPAKAKKTLEEFRRVIDRGAALLIYPEGTTTSGKVSLLPFKSTAFEAVCGTEKPIHMFLTHYEPDDARDAEVALYDHTGFLKHVWRVLGNGSVRAVIVPLEPLIPGKSLTRKELAQQAYDCMQNAHNAYLTNRKPVQTPPSV